MEYDRLLRITGHVAHSYVPEAIATSTDVAARMANKSVPWYTLPASSDRMMLIANPMRGELWRTLGQGTTKEVNEASYHMVRGWGKDRFESLMHSGYRLYASVADYERARELVTRPPIERRYDPPSSCNCPLCRAVKKHNAEVPKPEKRPDTIIIDDPLRYIPEPDVQAMDRLVKTAKAEREYRDAIMAWSADMQAMRGRPPLVVNRIRNAQDSLVLRSRRKLLCA